MTVADRIQVKAGRDAVLYSVPPLTNITNPTMTVLSFVGGRTRGRRHTAG